MGCPGGSVVKNPPANVRDMDSIPVLGRFPEEGIGNPLQYSCLRNLMKKGAWQATVRGVAKRSQTQFRNYTSRPIPGLISSNLINAYI